MQQGGGQPPTRDTGSHGQSKAEPLFQFPEEAAPAAPQGQSYGVPLQPASWSPSRDSGDKSRETVKGNVPFGLAAGLIAAIITGILWGSTAQKAASVPALIIALAVGYAIQSGARGFNWILGPAGAFITLAGVWVGWIITAYLEYAAGTENVGPMQAFSTFSLDLIVRQRIAWLTPIDVGVVAVALYLAWRTSNGRSPLRGRF